MFNLEDDYWNWTIATAMHQTTVVGTKLPHSAKDFAVTITKKLTTLIDISYRHLKQQHVVTAQRRTRLGARL